MLILCQHWPILCHSNSPNVDYWVLFRNITAIWVEKPLKLHFDPASFKAGKMSGRVCHLSFSGLHSQNSTDWCPGGSYSGLLIYTLVSYRAVSLGRATCCQHNCEKKYCTYGRCGLKGTFTIYVEDTETKYQSFRDTAGKGPESKRLAPIPFSLTWH